LVDTTSFGEAKVQQLDACAALLGALQEDVAGLDVTVHQPSPVHEAETRQELLPAAVRQLGIERARSQPRLQALSLEQLHHQKGHIPLDAEIGDRDDVRMSQGAEGARLSLEALARAPVFIVLLAEHLERDQAVQGEMSGA
jgi:hypothetical protein